MTTMWLSAGGAIVDGVLTEPPGWVRLPIECLVAGGVLTLSAGITFGPFHASTGPLAAFALFDAEKAGTMLYSATMPSLTVPAGHYLSFPAGNYAVTAASAPGADVLTLNGQPLTIDGQPLLLG